jgi:hypothetical protein
MDFTSLVLKYRKIIVIALINIVGLVLLLLVVSWIKGFAAGEIPSIHASTEETVEFLADPSMKLHSKDDRLAYVNELVEVYTSSPEKLNNFAGEIYQFQDNMFEVAKDQIVDDAIIYASLSPLQKREFVRNKVQHMSNLQKMMKGKSGSKSGRSASGKITKGGNGGVNLTKTKVNKNIPSEPAAVYAKILDKTNPSERAQVDTYISAVQTASAELKKLQK